MRGDIGHDLGRDAGERPVAEGQKACGDKCIGVTQCCTSDDCSEGQFCENRFGARVPRFVGVRPLIARIRKSRKWRARGAKNSPDGWLLALAVAVLSLPPWYRPVTGMPHALEHFSMFFAMGLAFGLGYSTPYLSQLLLLIAFTAAIEIAQLWVLGRHARFSDFLVDALGVAIGVGVGRMQSLFTRKAG